MSPCRVELKDDKYGHGGPLTVDYEGCHVTEGDYYNHIQSYYDPLYTPYDRYMHRVLHCQYTYVSANVYIHRIGLIFMSKYMYAAD
jgi:hypothetical protein